MNLTYKSWLSCVCVALILAGVLAPMQAATRTWDNGGGDGKWSTAANWSDDTRPTNADDVVFDATSTANCTVDSNAAWATLTTTTGYTGTINFGASIDTAYGNTRFSAATAITAGTSKLVFANTSAAVCSLGNPANQRLYDVAHTGSGALNFKTSGTSAYINGDFTRTGSGALTLTCGIQYADDIYWDGTGNITLPNGMLRGNGNGKTFHIGNTVGTVTNVGCQIRFYGTNMTMDFDNALTPANELNIQATGFVATGAGVVLLRSSGVPPFVMASNCKATFNNTGTYKFRRIGTVGNVCSFGANDTIDGNGRINFEAEAQDVRMTIPAILYTGSGQITIQAANRGIRDCGFRATGNWNFGSAPLHITYSRDSTAAKKITVLLDSFNLTCGDLAFGARTTDTTVMSFGRGTHSIGNIVNTYNSATGRSDDTMSSATIICAGNITIGSKHNVLPGTSIWNITGTSTITSNGKQFADSLACTGSGTVSLADNLTCGALRVSSGVLNISGDSVYCARYAGVATGAALTTDASSRLRLGDGGRLDMGGKNWPPTWFAGSARIYDGGTFANIYMAGSGDSLMFEPAKRYTFTAFDRDNVKGSNGTTGKNYWVSQTPTQRDTIDLPSNVTLVNFYIRDQVFLDTVTCRRADSCYSGGGGY